MHTECSLGSSLLPAPREGVSALVSALLRYGDSGGLGHTRTLVGIGKGIGVHQHKLGPGVILALLCDC